MTGPDCPIHGDLVRDLALGTLGDSDARRAERALAECGRCHDWSAELAVEEVERGVADALAAFRPPARPAGARSFAAGPWARIAAAAVLAIGGGAAWLATGGRPDPGADTAATGAAGRHGAAAGAATSQAAAPGDTGRGEILLADDLESGTLDAWRVHPSS